jgi:alkylhydroperoxidase family enzyme
MDTAARGEDLAGDGADAVLLRLVRRMTETRGKLEDEEFQAFQSQGVTPEKMIAVIGEMAVCTVTNTFNRLAQTELDDYLAPYDY